MFFQHKGMILAKYMLGEMVRIIVLIVTKGSPLRSSSIEQKVTQLLVSKQRPDYRRAACST